ncbi:MAG: ABC transporter substrate-binding protein [Hyphomicrobiaceae bacterium]
MRRRTFVVALGGLVTSFGLVGPAAAEAPLKPPVTLTVGYVKVGHLAPMILISDALKKEGVNLKLVEFVRYADARTALLTGSLDAASVGAADLAIALSNGSTNVVGIMGVGSSKKYVIGRKGVKLESWADLKDKKVGIAPGSAVWFQFAATMIEKGIPYNSFKEVKIQGGGTAFDQALKRGDVDAIVAWEPFETIPVMEGYGFYAKNLEYSHSKAVGSELGMLMASKTAVTTKRAALQRFVVAYTRKEAELQADKPAFAAALAKLTGLGPEISKKIAQIITLGAVVTPEQIKRQAKAFHDLGVIPKDVSGEIEKYWDGNLVADASK